MDISKNIIDTNKPEFSHLPKTLNGEVLLENHFDESGKLIGVTTATQAIVNSMMSRADNDPLLTAGWKKHKDTLTKG
jgi:hypothetical protein